MPLSAAPFGFSDIMRSVLRLLSAFGQTTRRARTSILLTIAGVIFWAVPMPVREVILWSDSGPRIVHQTGTGNDILAGAVKRDDSANDTLYFKFHIDALSDKSTEEYFAALELFDGDIERLGIGNALKAWAYSAFFNAEQTAESAKTAEYIDLHSANPHLAEDGAPTSYQFP